MSDAIAVKVLKNAYVQENGIIRLEDGTLIGRLNGIEYEQIPDPENDGTDECGICGAKTPGENDLVEHYREKHPVTFNLLTEKGGL